MTAHCVANGTGRWFNHTIASTFIHSVAGRVRVALCFSTFCDEREEWGKPACLLPQEWKTSLPDGHGRTGSGLHTWSELAGAPREVPVLSGGNGGGPWRRPCSAAFAGNLCRTDRPHGGCGTDRIEAPYLTQPFSTKARSSRCSRPLNLPGKPNLHLVLHGSDARAPWRLDSGLPAYWLAVLGQNSTAPHKVNACEQTNTRTDEV